MSFGFAKPTIRLETADGWHVHLLEYLDYTDSKGRRFRMRVGSESDGASSPRASWPIIPPFGDYYLAVVLHDGAYRNTLETLTDSGTWVIANLSKDDCDWLLLDAMTSLGVKSDLRDAIYEGVHLAGDLSFAEDRKENIVAAIVAHFESSLRAGLSRL